MVFNNLRPAAGTLFFFLSLILFSGCAAQHVYIDRAIIRNESGGVISEVRVRHEPTGKIGQVHSILPGSSLDLGFARSLMLAKRSIITWESQGGQVYRVELELPRYHDSSDTKGPTSSLVYTIHPDESVTVELVQ